MIIILNFRVFISFSYLFSGQANGSTGNSKNQNNESFPRLQYLSRVLECKIKASFRFLAWFCCYLCCHTHWFLRVVLSLLMHFPLYISVCFRSRPSKCGYEQGLSHSDDHLALNWYSSSPYCIWFVANKNDLVSPFYCSLCQFNRYKWGDCIDWWFVVLSQKFNLLLKAEKENWKQM